ncbi:hypothetical protein [Enhygromyxa salina]|uniref:hypothetical protein n=1 Tax=Enhygromyxa salina TaxID=215803 RepID=UPI0011B248B6|nr:hypothetical protein [Enhygromyxa salina]
MPSESSEGGDTELEDGSLDHVAFVSPLRASRTTATRLAMLQHALPRLNAGYDGLERERGPPIG